MPLIADLHIHTSKSDGAFSPIEIIDKARAAGLDIISITDHDQISGYLEAADYAECADIRLIPGIEISSEIENREIHLLGYFINTDSKALLDYLAFTQEARIDRAKAIIKKLNDNKIDISLDEIPSDETAFIGRVQIAKLMVQKSYSGSIKSAFSSHLGNKKYAYVRNRYYAYRKAIQLIKEAGGLAFIAHPGNIDHRLLDKLCKKGLDGIELVHPSHNKFTAEALAEYAAKKNLLTSGGSDFHGIQNQDEHNLGKYYIAALKVHLMTERIKSQSGVIYEKHN